MANMNILTPKRGSRNAANNLDKIKMETREKRRNILYLILSYLKDNMLEQTAEALAKETQLDDGYRVCENVELDIILQEYQSYYYSKFQKYPKIIRKLEETELKQANNVRSSRRGKSAAKRSTPTLAPPKEKTDSLSAESDADFQFEIVSFNGSTSSKAKINNNTSKPDKPKPFLPDVENYTSENKDLINQISNQEVLVKDMGVAWSDCLGLDNAIEILKECTIYPIRYPDIFKDMIPWRGVLLHGPPGTGKTLLAKALASEGQTTFFNVTSSTFISKWRGESEKLIKHLFDMAKLHAPSTIFLDEIDALVSGIKDIQHEASKRFRSELLVQLDGISSTDDNGQIFVLASTNSPWDLDDAVLRRFDKRILVDMPTKQARAHILKHHLKNTIEISPNDMDQFGNLTEHYSGCDIKNVSKEVSMMGVRERIKSVQKGIKNTGGRVLGFDDVKLTLQKIRPSTSSSMCKKYYQWQNEHGAL